MAKKPDGKLEKVVVIKEHVQGPVGPQGPAGVQGIQGIPGVPGRDGKDGQDGRPGAPGRPGYPGKDGKDGRDGKDGISPDITAQKKQLEEYIKEQVGKLPESVMGGAGRLDVQDLPGYREANVGQVLGVDTNGNVGFIDQSGGGGGGTWGSITGTLSDQTDLQTELDAKQEHENGFENRTDSTISFDDATRTFTIAPAVSSYVVYIQNQKVVKTATENVVISDTEGIWAFYFDAAGTLQATNNVAFIETIILEFAFIAIVYWDAENNTAITFGEERHGANMSAATHAYNHNTFGTRYGEGLTPGDLVSDGNGDLDTHAQFSVTGGSIWDEDIENVISSIIVGTGAPFFYRSGAAGNWRKLAATGFLAYNGGAGRAQFNELTGGVWQLTEVNNPDFVLMHLYATNDPDQPFFLIMGQAQYTTLGNARDGALTELINLETTGLPIVEYKSIATFIMQTSNGYSNAVQSRLRTTDDGADYIDWRGTDTGVLVSVAGSSTQTAAQVPFTPAGNIAATDVQAAIEELDSEKATAAQGALADTATQPGDNVSTLTNDANYVSFTQTTTAVNKTLAANEKCSVTASGLTITLPASPANGDECWISVGNFVDTIIARNGNTILGIADNAVINAEYATAILRWMGSSWSMVLVDGSTDSFELINDTTPQLGGDLDVNGFNVISTSNGNISLVPNGTGKVGIGTASPGQMLEVYNAPNASGESRIRITGGTSGDSTIQFADTADVNVGEIFYSHANNIMRFRVNDANRVQIESNGDLRPLANGTQDLGGTSLRWNTVYATNGTINTSDERLKKDVRPISLRETLVARTMSKQIKAFKWKEGKDKAIHFGVMAQELELAFAREGLNATDYGMFSKDDEGNLGVNYTELLMFIIAAEQGLYT